MSAIALSGKRLSSIPLEDRRCGARVSRDPRVLRIARARRCKSFCVEARASAAAVTIASRVAREILLWRTAGSESAGTSLASHPLVFKPPARNRIESSSPRFTVSSPAFVDRLPGRFSNVLGWRRHEPMQGSEPKLFLAFLGFYLFFNRTRKLCV